MKIYQKYKEIKTVKDLKKAIDDSALYKIPFDDRPTQGPSIDLISIDYQRYNYEELLDKLLCNFYYRKNNRNPLY